MNRAERNPEIVSASDIAAWSWCSESWRLRSLGSEPENHPAMEEGKAFHERKAQFERRSRSAISLGWLFIAGAVLLAAMAFILMGG